MIPRGVGPRENCHLYFFGAGTAGAGAGAAAFTFTSAFARIPAITPSIAAFFFSPARYATIFGFA